VLIVNKRGVKTAFGDRAVKCGAAADSPFVSEVQEKLSQTHLVVVTGESGAGKTFGAVMAAAQSARLPDGTDSHKAVVLYFSGFDVVRASASASPSPSASTVGSPDALKKIERGSSKANKEAYDGAVLKVVEDAVVNTLERLDVPTGETDNDGRRVVVVLDEMGSERDVLRALCAMHADSGAGRGIESVSENVRKKYPCGPVYFIAVGTGCDTAVWQAGSSPASYSAIPATSASGREVFRGIIGAKIKAYKHRDIHLHIQRHAASICSLKEGNHDTAPTSHAWSAIGHALVGNARVAALVARGIVEALTPKKKTKYFVPSDQAATLEDVVREVLLNAMRVFATLNALSALSVLERNHAVAQAAALMFSATDADLPEDLEKELGVRYGIVTSNAVHVSRTVPADCIALQADDDARDGARRPGGDSGNGVVCVREVLPRYSVSPAHLVMLLLSFGHTKRAATGVGFDRVIHDVIAVCVPAVIAARMWAESSDARLQKLAEPSSRVAKLRSVAAASAEGRGPAPTVHPFFEVLYAAAETKGITTMQHWVRGSAIAKLEPTVRPTDEPTGRGSIFGEWLERLAASVTDTRRLPDAAVVLNGRGASGPDVIALFSPAKVRGSSELPATVFVQCRRHQTPETQQTWRESVLSVLDGFVQMGAPAFQFAKCREALAPPRTGQADT
jgi:hypothetical protein